VGERHPPVGDDKHDFKKGLKGRLVVVAVVGFGFHHVIHKIIAD